MKKLSFLIVLLFSLVLSTNALAESNDIKIKGKYDVVNEIISESSENANEKFLGINGKPKNTFLQPNLSLTEKIVDDETIGVVEGNIVLKLPARAIQLKVEGELIKYTVDNNETWFGPLTSTFNYKGEDYPVTLGFFYDETNDTVTSSVTVGYVDDEIGTSHLMFGELTESYTNTFAAIYEKSKENEEKLNAVLEEPTVEPEVSMMSTAEYNYKGGTYTSYLSNENTGEGSNSTWVVYGFAYAQDGTLGGGRTGNGYVHLNMYTNSKNVERYVNNIGGKNAVAWVDRVFVDFQARNTTISGGTNLWTNDTWRINFHNPKEATAIPKLTLSVPGPYGPLIKLGLNAVIAGYNANLPISTSTSTYGGDIKKYSHTFNPKLSNVTDFSTSSYSAVPAYNSNVSSDKNRGFGTKYGYASDLGGSKGSVQARFQARWLVSSDITKYQGYYTSRNAYRTFTIEL